MQRAGHFSGLYDSGAAANPAADGYRRIKTYLVTAEIDGPRKVLDLDEVAAQSRNQGKREITVSYSLAIGQLLPGPLGIDMNPLKIAGCLGEAVDFLLVDFYPVGQTDFLPFQRFRVFD